jgi:hypothetical protein
VTPRAFVQQGESEPLKGACHATTAALLGIMTVYNVTAWLYRRDTHLAFNSIIYLAGLCLEGKKTYHHFNS